MKIEVDKDLLLKSVNIADSVVPAKSVNSVLGNCLFIVDKENIIICATDNEIGIRTKIESKSDESGSFTVNGKKLYEILSRLPKGDVIITVDNNFSINIKSKKLDGFTKLVGFSSDEYPSIPDFVDKNSIEIDQQLLKEIIKKVIYAAAKDNIKPVFNGLFISFEEGKFIAAVATDSRRLSFIKRNLEKEIDKKEGIIIPLKTIDQINKILENEGSFNFSLNNNQCFFKIGDTEIISRIIDGQFPNYKQVIPKEFSSKVVINTVNMLDALQRAKPITDEHASKKILLKFSKNILEISASYSGLGEFEEKINIESNLKEDIVIGINSEYLKEALKEINSISFEIGITGQMSPLVIKPEDDENYISVVMPIQIKSSED